MNQLPMKWAKDANPELNGEDFAVIMNYPNAEPQTQRDELKLVFRRGTEEWAIPNSGVKLIHRLLSQVLTSCPSCGVGEVFSGEETTSV